MSTVEKKKLDTLKICVTGRSTNYKRLKDLKSTKLKAAFVTKLLWPSHTTIKVYFMKNNNKINIPRQTAEQIMETSNKTDIDPLQYKVDKMKNMIEAIKLIVKDRFEQIVNIKFEYVNNMKNSDIRIDFDPDNGCWSYVGTDCKGYKNEATMNFSWFDVPTVLHEFGHALGMIHEHQNPKNNKIKWDDKAVFAWGKQTQGWNDKTTYENIIAKPTEQINGSDYDPESIMLYFFPAQLTTNNKGTSENLILSPNDVLFLAQTYPGKQKLDKIYKEWYGKDIDSELILEKNTNKKVKFIKDNIYISIIAIIVLIILTIFISKKYENKFNI